MNDKHIAVELTKEARGNVFVDSEINGRLKIAGKNNKLIRTEVSLFKNTHPVIFWIGFAASIFGIIQFTVWLGDLFGN